MIQLYGHFHNHFSFGRVSRGYASALANARLPFSIWNVGNLFSPEYVDAPWDIGLHAESKIGIAIGYPPASVKWLEGHEIRILATVCETDRIPASWVQNINSSVDRVWVPSWYCQQAFENSGVTVPVEIVRHGVYPRTVYRGMHPMLPVRLLHVSGSGSFPWRKGTAPLLRAVAEMGDRVSLTLVGSGKLVEAAEAAGVASVRHVSTPKGFTTAAFQRLLVTADAVVQPSRGEGFGMVPLEARCLGVPVIMTGETGHAEHRADCDVIVPTGYPTPMETQGNGAGAAPTVSSEAVLKCLQYYMRTHEARRNETFEWARWNTLKWSWDAQLADAMRYLKVESKGRRRLWG